MTRHIKLFVALFLLLFISCKLPHQHNYSKKRLAEIEAYFKGLIDSECNQGSPRLIKAFFGPGDVLILQYTFFQFNGSDIGSSFYNKVKNEIRSILLRNARDESIFQDLAKFGITLNFEYYGVDGSELFRHTFLPVEYKK